MSKTSGKDRVAEAAEQTTIRSRPRARACSSKLVASGESRFCTCGPPCRTHVNENAAVLSRRARGLQHFLRRDRVNTRRLVVAAGARVFVRRAVGELETNAGARALHHRRIDEDEPNKTKKIASARFFFRRKSSSTLVVVFRRRRRRCSILLINSRGSMTFFLEIEADDHKHNSRCFELGSSNVGLRRSSASHRPKIGDRRRSHLA